MIPRTNPSAEIAALAAAQDGVITSAVAEQLGVSRNVQARLVREGRWQRVTQGVLFVHDGTVPWRALAWTGVLLGGDSAVLGGEAAAFLHGLIDDEPDHFVIWHTGHASSRDEWVLRRDMTPTRRVHHRGAPPRTSVEDTVLDLCDRRLGLTERAPIDWLTAAVQRRKTTPALLRRALTGRARMSGRAEIEALLADVRSGAQSPLEIRYRRDVERAHGLPEAERQARFAHAGRSGFRDVRYDKFGVLVELDGRLGHFGAGRFRDYRRDNAALLDGQAPMRFGWTDVTESPCEVAAQVAAMLQRGGWTGFRQPCRRCRFVVRDFAA